jgi:lysophospholipase L1-like esterase
MRESITLRRILFPIGFQWRAGLRAIIPVLLAITGSASCFAESPRLPNAPDKFESEISAMESSFSLQKPPGSPVVFYGSSSIRLWKSLKEDFSGYPVLNCGFGGSRLTDCVKYANRLVIPRRPAAIVIYAGDNDLATGIAPEAAFQSFQQLFRIFRSYSNSMPLAFVSVKPSPARFQYLANIFRFNKLVADYLEGQPETEYIDICSDMLGPNRKPNPALFVSDQIHLNQDGYKILRRDIGEFLTDECTKSVARTSP